MSLSKESELALGIFSDILRAPTVQRARSPSAQRFRKAARSLRASKLPIMVMAADRSAAWRGATLTVAAGGC